MDGRGPAGADGAAVSGRTLESQWADGRAPRAWLSPREVAGSDGPTARRAQTSVGTRWRADGPTGATVDESAANERRKDGRWREDGEDGATSLWVQRALPSEGGWLAATGRRTATRRRAPRAQPSPRARRRVEGRRAPRAESSEQARRRAGGRLAPRAQSLKPRRRREGGRSADRRERRIQPTVWVAVGGPLADGRPRTRSSTRARRRAGGRQALEGRPSTGRMAESRRPTGAEGAVAEGRRADGR